MQIGVMFGNPETTTGGKALKFYTSVRLDIRRIAQIKKGEEVVGGRHRVKVVKNKVAAPFRVTEFDLMYNEGISTEGELLALGERLGVVQKSGSSYSFGEEKLGRGYDASRTYLRENKKVANELLKANPQSSSATCGESAHVLFFSVGHARSKLSYHAMSVVS
jgi:recombination protein RecA